MDITELYNNQKAIWDIVQQGITYKSIRIGDFTSFLDNTDTPSSYSGQATKAVVVKSDETGLEFATIAVTDVKVGIDAGATAGYLGASSGDGVIRTGALLTYTDGGDFITIAVDEASIDHGAITGLGDDDHTQYIKHALATATNDFLVASGSGAYIKKTLAETGAILEGDIDHGNIQGLGDGSDHSFIDQDVTSGSTPTFTGTNFTGIPVAGTALVAGTNITLATNTLNVDDAFLINDGDDVTTGKIEMASLEITASINHTVTDSSDDLLFINPNSNGNFVFRVNSAGTNHDFLTVDASVPRLLLQTDSEEPIGTNGLFSITGPIRASIIGACMNFSPTVTGASFVAVVAGPTMDTSSVVQAFRLLPNWTAGSKHYMQAMFVAPQTHEVNNDDDFTAVTESGIFRNVNAVFFDDASNIDYNWLIFGGAVSLIDIGATVNADYEENILTMTGGATRPLGVLGSVIQRGLKMRGWGTQVALQAGDLVRALDADGGIFAHAYDYTGSNNGIFFGTGIDVGMGYDGTDFIIDTQLVGTGALALPKTSTSGIKVDTTTPTFGWRDITGEITNAGGANKPTNTTYRGGIDQFRFSAGDESIIRYHIPHDYVAGTDIHIHVHWSHISAIVTGGTITFTAESIYAKGHNQTAFSAPVTGTFVGTASTTQYQHIISETQYSASSPAGLQLDTDDLEPDGVILIRLEMTTNNITSSGAVPDPFIHEVDIHYQSTNIGTKDKAPDFYT